VGLALAFWALTSFVALMASGEGHSFERVARPARAWIHSCGLSARRDSVWSFPCSPLHALSYTPNLKESAGEQLAVTTANADCASIGRGAGCYPNGAFPRDFVGEDCFVRHAEDLQNVNAGSTSKTCSCLAIDPTQAVTRRASGRVYQELTRRLEALPACAQ